MLVSGTRTRRAPERRTAVLESVYALLAEVGYDRMTMDAVAARAHVSKATIYRIWPDKPDLVAEALGCHFQEMPALTTDTGSLRGDLMAIVTTACEVCDGSAGEVIAGVLTAAALHPALARTLHESTYERKHAIHEAVIRRAVDRGEVQPGTDSHLLHEVLFAMVLTRRLRTDQPLDERFARHVVDDVLLPVLTNRAR
ncbi:MAG TPA: TetR/AcrR family transcriptional regulator [Pseudonocardiaceae bacterium]|jgi:AcrR family transcriptional regulator|nr:TetR/AcrR family transcriptional regulator [Pseudonocardiaceae bacterium]